MFMPFGTFSKSFSLLRLYGYIVYGHLNSCKFSDNNRVNESVHCRVRLCVLYLDKGFYIARNIHLIDKHVT